jgi:thiol-disulfide isomerase/thioredoxin
MKAPSRQQHPVAPRHQSGAARRAAAAAARARARRRRYIVSGLGAGVLGTAVVLAVVIVSLTHNTSSSGSNRAVAVGQPAPDGTFTTLSGKTLSVASLRGTPVLLWFVTTWCSSCQAGTPVMANALPEFAAHHVRVVEVENYQDLGQPGPSMRRFAKALAGSQYGNPDWTFGAASQALTEAYNPKGYLDIYYLLNARGRVAYINSSPGSTMQQLLGQVTALA